MTTHSVRHSGAERSEEPGIHNPGAGRLTERFPTPSQSVIMDSGFALCAPRNDVRGKPLMKFGVFDHMDDAGIPHRRAVCRPAAACRGLRPRRLPRLSPRRASRHADRLRGFAGNFPRRAGAAHRKAALRSVGLSVAVLSSAAADRGNLHARSVERRAASSSASAAACRRSRPRTTRSIFRKPARCITRRSRCCSRASPRTS